MAALHDITIKTERRACLVNGKKAMWHKWVESSEAVGEYIIKDCHGLIEFEDGTVRFVYPTNIKFADGGDFNETAWNIK